MMLESFDSPIINILGVVIGIIGVLLAIAFYFKSRRFKRISYVMKSFNLINDTISSLQGFTALYHGHSMNNLTALKVFIWNSGSEVVSDSDIASTDPIILVFKDDVKVLNVKISSISNPANSAHAIVDGNANNICVINFDFMSKKDGFILSALTTGQEEDRPIIKGTIKGGGSPILYKANPAIEIIYTLFVALSFPFAAGVASLFESRWVLIVVGVTSFYVYISLLSKIKECFERKTRDSLDYIFEESFSPKEFT